MGLSRRWSVRVVVFLASLLVLASAQQQQPPPPRLPRGAAEMSADVDAILARVCDPRGSSRPAAAPLSWCHELRLRRRRSGGGGGGGGSHHRRPSPLPPPGRDEEADARYGVAKRLVPTGPNPLHN
ncbi:hypothetical protein GUJ93_ZPchr0005g15254 [Zizania palustris]|uniref:Uncharacterized protein n=1 Tax=Zizania palustris TaxID=103762 RepID=A0A8J5T800_ZIZPA|nr:hypothetical protein GUJ93_ZPchr0005g15254 [Zizania palustris]